jgi:23S rRNA (uracil1939-C5)-methyltransferase
MIKAEVYSLAYGGAGVARLDGKVCFVKGALPGEEASIKIVKQTPKYSEAEVVEIIKPSPDRTHPVCPYYARCGACQLQHISYSRELYYKKEQICDLFGRIAGMDISGMIGDLERSPSEYGYRTSVTVHRGDKGYGYYAGSSHMVINIDRCPIAGDPINDVLKELTLGEDKDEITLKADHDGRVWSSCRMGNRFYLDRYRGVDIYLSPKAFSQCNRHISERMAETLEGWIGADSEGAGFFDIYCGAGFFSFLVNGGFSSKTGIDENRISIDCAKNTVKHNGSRGIKFYRGSAEEDFFGIFAREKKQKNIFLLDPPRKGVTRQFLERIRDEKDVCSIYYISCDPARMARDSKILTQDGKWSLKRIKAFDMFPRTKHIEALAEFTRPI